MADLAEKSKSPLSSQTFAEQLKIQEEDVLELAEQFQNIDVGGPQSRNFIDSVTAVADLVHSLVNLPSRPPSLYIDLEGINLSRKGPISIMQILVLPENQTYLIDIHKLGSEAFSTPGKSGETLKGILESKSIPKVFFDVRNDSAALFSHFQIDLAGIHDLQLMELATRSFSKRCLKGLTKCIEGDLSLTSAEIKVCKEIKEKGLSLFAPERGGSYEVFNVRPLDNEMRLYCIQDVQFMPQLWSCYHSRMKVNWEKRVERATNDRVALSQTESYNGQGRHMALAPAGWA